MSVFGSPPNKRGCSRWKAQSSLQPILSDSKAEEVLKSIHSEAMTVMLWQPSSTYFSWPNKPHLLELLCQNLQLYFVFCSTPRKPDQNYIVVFVIIVLSMSTSKNNENTCNQHTCNSTCAEFLKIRTFASDQWK